LLGQKHVPELLWWRPLLAGSASRPPQELPIAAAPAGRLSQHQNRWSVDSGAKVKVDQRPQSAPPTPARNRWENVHRAVLMLHQEQTEISRNPEQERLKPVGDAPIPVRCQRPL